MGEVLALTLDLFPLAAAEEADLVDDAFRVLTVEAVPVFAFVLAALVYSVLRFRRRGEPVEDGPPIRTHGPVVATWLLVTTALTILVIIFPGITGIRELRAEKDVDLVVQVTGVRFAWIMAYPEYGVTTNELVLPVGKRVRFEVTATDVLHAFWVPAFRMKVDAVPGLVTTIYVTPNKTGTLDDDSGFRLQCAELCGLSHSIMSSPVRVVEPGQFDEWVAQHGGSS